MRTLKVVGILALAAVLSACTTPAVHVTNKLFNFGADLPAEMRDAHIAAWVGFDEVWVDRYNNRSRTALYSQGVERGTPEYDYRVVLINMSNTSPDVLWKKQGELTFATGAYVPDHLPRLMAGDIVEIRNTGTWHTMKNFSQTQEGNVVVKVLCRAADADYDACLDRQPRVGTFKGKGQTGSPFPSSVSAYGYTFTPIYDKAGVPLRGLTQ